MLFLTRYTSYIYVYIWLENRQHSSWCRSIVLLILIFEFHLPGNLYIRCTLFICIYLFEWTKYFFNKNKNWRKKIVWSTKIHVKLFHTSRSLQRVHAHVTVAKVSNQFKWLNARFYPKQINIACICHLKEKLDMIFKNLFTLILYKFVNAYL